MSPLKEIHSSTPEDIFLLERRRKKETPRHSSKYDEFFQKVTAAIIDSPNSTITLVFEGEAATAEAYLAQQFIRHRMSRGGPSINTALDRDIETGQARLVVGPYTPKK